MTNSKVKTWTDPRCRPLDMPEGLSAPFLLLDDGSVMTVKGNATLVSKDDGKTWSDPRPIYTGPKPGIPGGRSLLLRTQNGVIVNAYMDHSTVKWRWDDDAGAAHDDIRLDVWTIRSLDEGETWIDRQRVMEGYCGALINIIQLRRGKIVLPVQRMLRDPGRHATSTYVSEDEGKTWSNSNIIDIGGHGHHDGAMEVTVEELGDGRVWMLIRTTLDRFWEGYSMDEGASWRVIQPTSIDASSAPGYLLRLASGRLVLAWNRLYPEGRDMYARRGGQASELLASGHREELSIAFSENDGKTWTDSVVIARDERMVPYPNVFERRPGELWITVPTGVLRVSLSEDDFVK